MVKLFIAIIVSIFLTNITLAQSKGDFDKCKSVNDNLGRLSCYDNVFIKTKASNLEIRIDIQEITAVDFLTDFNEMLGRNVKVKGFGIVLGENLLLYPKMGDSSAIWVNMIQVIREDRKKALSDCGSGCKMSVIGKAARHLGQPGISATNFDFN